MQTTFPVLLSDAMVAIPLLMSTIVNAFPALAGGDYIIQWLGVRNCWLRQIQTVTQPILSAGACDFGTSRSARQHFWVTPLTHKEVRGKMHNILHKLGEVDEYR